ncbi:MAG: AAA family ATPase [Spirochaetes bacterium]|jgi:superfamily I DNA/RNA helicase|nr:AAA family ATPase [Spirochaetota bacterium]
MALDARDIEGNLRRIISLNGSDEGFYVLALHSLIEAYAITQYPQLDSEFTPFRQKIDAIFHGLGKLDPETGRVPELARRITQRHRATNGVRHRFEELSGEEARSATHDFIKFCRLLGWDHAELMADLEESLKLWKGKQAPLDQFRALRRLRLDYNRVRQENEELQTVGEASRDWRQELERVQRELQEKDAEVQRLKETASGRKEKADDLRRRLHEAERAREELAAQAEKLRGADVYVSYLERFTSYTRSRADYERSVMALSPEQKQAAERIRDRGDYLISGPAGTGKTLVLLHALDGELTLRDQELGLTEEKPVALLTFTRTLVRFDEYLTHVLGRHEASPKIATVDSFVLQRLRAIDERYHVDYKYLRRWTDDHPLPFLSGEELHAEIEDVILGRALSRSEYVDDAAPRRGRKQPLLAEQRAQVWERAAEVRADMLGQYKVSKTLSRIVLLQHLESSEEERARHSVARLFIDEVQDLAPVEVRMLKLLSENGVVMAGDEGQAIYQAGMTFKRLGVGIVGHSAILKTNYRNTRQIMHLAEVFRALWQDRALPAPDAIDDAFRDGPSPELWLHGDAADAEDGLQRRVEFFVSTLGYDPENVAVLTAFSDGVSRIRNVLKEAGYETVDIREKSFDFESTRGVRVSTMHSAKGVEFPVVMLYAPSLRRPDGVSSRAADEQGFNLFYVAITRAMDNLQLFLPAATDVTPIRVLGQAQQRFAEIEQAADATAVGGDAR